MQKIFIIGDSNTYGWEPRDMMGGPYPKPWPVFLKDAGFTVAVDAVPGCEVPHFPQLINEEIELIGEEEPDLLMIMLGSNDILNMNEPDCETAIKRMSAFVEKIRAAAPAKMKILLMEIPEIRIPGAYQEVGKEYNIRLGQLAAEKGCLIFAVPDELPLAYDGVHLTEVGHHMLGENVVKFINAFSA